MFCDNCGTKLNEGDLFCPTCGQKTDEIITDHSQSQEQLHAPYIPPVEQSQQYEQQTPYTPQYPNQGVQYTEHQPPYAPPQYPYGQMPPDSRGRKPANRKTGMIIGIVAGSILLLALIIFLVLRFAGGNDDEIIETTERPERTTESIVETTTRDTEATELTETTTTAETEPQPTTEETSVQTDYDLAGLLPGVWVSLPNTENYSFVYGFTEDGRVGSSFAYSENDEQTLDNWDTPGAWIMDPYSWGDWRLEGGDIVFSDSIGVFRIKINVVDEDEIKIKYEGTNDDFSLFRVGTEPVLSDFIIGTWIPDISDEDGVYSVLSFYQDNSAVMTGANKLDDSATVDDWGFDEYWEVFGEAIGIWLIDNETLIIRLDGTDDEYEVSIDGANRCTIYYGDGWQMSYTRVAYSY